MDRIFRCSSDIFKVSRKRETGELEESHYTLQIMLPYHAATLVGKMKKKHMHGEGVCVFIRILIFVLL